MKWTRAETFAAMDHRAARDVPRLGLLEQPERYRGHLLRLRLHILRHSGLGSPQEFGRREAGVRGLGLDRSVKFPLCLCVHRAACRNENGRVAARRGRLCRLLPQGPRLPSAVRRNHAAPLLVGRLQRAESSARLRSSPSPTGTGCGWQPSCLWRSASGSRGCVCAAFARRPSPRRPRPTRPRWRIGSAAKEPRVRLTQPTIAICNESRPPTFPSTKQASHKESPMSASEVRPTVAGVEVRGPLSAEASRILTPAALEFIRRARAADPRRRRALLSARAERSKLSTPANCPTFRRKRPSCAATIGRLRRFPRRSPIGAWKSPGRSTARWSSTRSTPARRSSWPTSRTPHSPDLGQPARRPGQPARRRAPHDRRSPVPEGKAYQLERQDRDAARAPARLAPAPRSTCWSTASPSPAACSISACISSTTPASCSRAARAPTSTCPRWRATSRRACGTTSSCSPQEALGLPRGTIKAHGADRDHPRRLRDGRDPVRAARPHRRASTAAAGTTSSAASRSFASRPDFSSPTARRSR